MSAEPRNPWWARAACLAITILLLVIIFRRINFDSFLASITHMQPLWVLLGAAFYGFAVLCCGFRWHLSLRLTECSLHPSASCRLVYIGHFFVTALCGAAGGDFAKSAVYARWYRFPLPEVVAAAPLDRTMGLGGTVVLAGIVLTCAVLTGSFARLGSLNIPQPGVWTLLAALGVTLAVVALIVWRPRGESSIARTIRAFRAGGGRMVVTPQVVLPGVLLSLMAQASWSCAFALNLRAVTSTAAPWLEVLWVFAAITVVAGLSFTFGGAGVREVAALTFLAPYGVPASDCVAAALLTFVLRVGWAGIGAMMLWREEGLQSRHAQRVPPRTLSVVIPTFNEASVLSETVQRARALSEISEIIVVDGGSSDGTVAIAKRFGCRVLAAPRGRGAQMRLGAQQATGDVVMLLHADTWLSPQAGYAALNCLRDATVVAGGFWKSFRATPFLLLGSRFRCGVRLLLGRRILGDQVLFIRREILEMIGGVPAQPLLEEFELCRRLRRVGRLALADATVTTSARRFQELGVLRTYFRMWRVSTLYRLGVSPAKLVQLYERGRGRIGSDSQ
jgi:rSAM/selenodomain-associated transferase 2